MARVKQFADDLGISTKKAKDLINKGRNRKDGGSKILESVMADKTKDKKKKKKKSEKLQPDIGRRAPPMYERDLEIRPRTAEYRKEMDNIDFSGMKPDVYSNGGSNVTKINKDKLSKAQMGQFRNIQRDAVKGKISSAEAQKMIRKMLTIKRKDGGLQDIPSDNKGLPNLPTEVRNKMGYKKNGGMQTSPKQRKHGTAKGMGTGLSKKPQIVKSPHARGGGIAIQGLGFKGVR